VASGANAKLMTAAVCTRNRGSRITCTVESILASAHPHFELLIVDQSTNDEAADALVPFLADRRLRYVRSATQGLGRARNLCLQEARGDVIAFTDDDCSVPPDWLAKMAEVFAEQPEVAVAFCNVDAAPYDASTGFIPAYMRRGDRLLSTIRDKCTARAIGAGIAVRRAMAQAIGGFDERLGAGAEFPSCEDGDMAVRALLRGYKVYETSRVAVLHYGYRTFAEGTALSRRDWIGIGAAYAKPLTCGYWRFLPVPAYEFFVVALWPLVRSALRLQKPRGFARVTGFLQGLRLGWKTPVDRETLRFR
jgi:glycosyltransferase involved in cell wall biosynthesis